MIGDVVKSILSVIQIIIASIAALFIYIATLPIRWMLLALTLYGTWMLFCLTVHLVDRYYAANGWVAHAIFDFLNPAGVFWTYHSGKNAPVIRLLADSVYPFGVFWSVLFPVALNQYISECS